MIAKILMYINFPWLTGFCHTKNTNRIWKSRISRELVFTNYPKLQKNFHAKSYPRPVDADIKSQKQPYRSVRGKRCSENMQQIYRRKPMPKCDFNKVALKLYWNRTSTWVFSYKNVAYFQSTFSWDTFRWLLLKSLLTFESVQIGQYIKSYTIKVKIFIYSFLVFLNLAAPTVQSMPSFLTYFCWKFNQIPEEKVVCLLFLYTRHSVKEDIIIKQQILPVFI